MESKEYYGRLFVCMRGQWICESGQALARFVSCHRTSFMIKSTFILCIWCIGGPPTAVLPLCIFQQTKNLLSDTLYSFIQWISLILRYLTDTNNNRLFEEKRCLIVERSEKWFILSGFFVAFSSAYRTERLSYTRGFQWPTKSLIKLRLADTRVELVQFHGTEPLIYHVHRSHRTLASAEGVDFDSGLINPFHAYTKSFGDQISIQYKTTQRLKK